MKMRSFLYAGLAASIVGIMSLQSPVFAAQEHALKTGATWSASCNTAMTCRLTTEQMPAKDGGLAIPTFVRGEKTGSPIQMVLPTPDGFDILDPSGLYNIAVDGKEVAAVSVNQLKRDPAEGGYVTSDPNLVNIVLVAAGTGKQEITVNYVGPEASEFVSADLGGFTQSLKWLSEQQGKGF